MKMLIIESKKNSCKSVLHEIAGIDENIYVIATCNNVTESIHRLQNNPNPDLVLMGIQLPAR